VLSQTDVDFPGAVGILTLSFEVTAESRKACSRGVLRVGSDRCGEHRQSSATRYDIIKSKAKKATNGKLF